MEFKCCITFVHIIRKYFRKSKSEKKLDYKLAHLSFPLLGSMGKFQQLKMMEHTKLTGSLIWVWEMSTIFVDVPSYYKLFLLLIK